MLVRQQAALDQLQQRAEISQSRPGLARTTTAGPSGSSVRPFDAQRRAGYGDRRYLGLYDARFHSTASYVGHRCIYTLVHACTRMHLSGVPRLGTFVSCPERSSSCATARAWGTSTTTTTATTSTGAPPNKPYLPLCPFQAPAS
jgi:hypothetical protein